VPQVFTPGLAKGSVSKPIPPVTLCPTLLLIRKFMPASSGTIVICFFKTLFMDTKDNDIERNRPSEKGRSNDDNLRDHTATQPGVSTISSSSTDDTNNHLTRTTSDGFTEDLQDEADADPTFDEGR
jgi:hypothetical protein